MNTDSRTRIKSMIVAADGRAGVLARCLRMQCPRAKASGRKDGCSRLHMSLFLRERRDDPRIHPQTVHGTRRFKCITGSEYMAVIPAQAGIQKIHTNWRFFNWIPAFAGMTIGTLTTSPIPSRRFRDTYGEAGYRVFRRRTPAIPNVVWRDDLWGG